jgi:hypothetical protein
MMKRETQQKLAFACQYGTPAEIVSALAPFLLEGGDWRKMAEKFSAYLKDGNPRFGIFQRNGNIKLPFAKFSSLPGVTCPGAGACLTFCYSFKAWRYPAAFFVQCQNTLLLRSETGRGQIASAFSALKEGCRFRLYVDGDFDRLETLRFWFELISSRPDIRAYGYSKSWEIFLSYRDAGGAFPANYKLNLSSGSIYSPNSGIARAVAGLPCVRGNFIAAAIAKENDAPIGARTLAYNRAVRESVGKRVFVCPGLCGSCTSNGPACGLDNFNGIDIAIGIHR